MNSFILLTIVAATSLALAQGASVRITGGDLAQRGQFPYQVGLTSKGKLLCGGVLVHERFALTAARCVFQNGVRIPEKSLRVFAGSERLMMGGQFRRVQAVHVHEQYAQNRFDLALVEINKPVAFSETVQAVAVGESAFNGAGEVTVTGWGRTAETENTSYKLKFATVAALSGEQCAQELGEAFYEGALCFRGEENKGVACFGDFGGPAVHENTLVGVASYSAGEACGSEQPDVFVDVGVFYDWIQEKIGGDDSGETTTATSA
uniref:Chymotrypsin-1 n=1 Tax=Culex pipiens TaxID=7175 RepID=A0A8D8CKV3_CULPI